MVAVEIQEVEGRLFLPLVRHIFEQIGNCASEEGAKPVQRFNVNRFKAVVVEVGKGFSCDIGFIVELQDAFDLALPHQYMQFAFDHMDHRFTVIPVLYPP